MCFKRYVTSFWKNVLENWVILEETLPSTHFLTLWATTFKERNSENIENRPTEAEKRFFSYLAKRTHLVTCFRKWHQKVRFPFPFFEICETWKFGHRAFSGGHETWEIDTCLTCSYGRTKRCLNMSFTQFVGHLLNFTRD